MIQNHSSFKALTRAQFTPIFNLNREYFVQMKFMGRSVVLQFLVQVEVLFSFENLVTGSDFALMLAVFRVLRFLLFNFLLRSP